MTSLKYDAKNVIFTNAQRSMYFDQTSPIAQCINVWGYSQNGEDISQSLICFTDVTAATYGATNVYLAKNAYVSMYNAILTVSGATDSASFLSTASANIQLTFYIGTNTTVDNIIHIEHLKVSPTVTYVKEIPDLNKIPVPTGKNIFLEISCTTAAVTPIVNLSCRLNIDD